MDIFKLYRYFWDFAFSNPELIRPNHCAVYSFSIEHCNRLGWKEKFGFPSSMAMEATGIKSYSVYKKTFDDLVEYGFFTVIQYSKNQYSSNIIALKENYKALDKALDKALTTHSIKHLRGTDSIIKQINQETINQETISSVPEKTDLTDFEKAVSPSEQKKEEIPPLGPPLFPKPPNILFSEIWELYDKKIGSIKKLQKKWEALSDKQRELARTHIIAYVKSTPDKKYRANFETYLNQERWTNEILNPLNSLTHEQPPIRPKQFATTDGR